LLLNLKRRYPSQVWVKKFSTVVEGRTTGADWEWWFGSAGKWFGMRVQAKKLDSRSLAYQQLDRRVGRTGLRQIDLLLQDAAARALYPLFCFYNCWDRTRVRYHWRCIGYSRFVRHLGCSVADARAVERRVSAARLEFHNMKFFLWPWMCLTCGCPGAQIGSLPYRVRSVAQRLAGENADIPDVREQAPPYVLELVRREPPEAVTVAGDAETPGIIDGLLAIDETRE
jgi:hypothetical protein